MNYAARRSRRQKQERWDAERVLRWIFTLGFAQEQAEGPNAADQRQALEDCGRVLPWVVAIAVIVWAQAYGLGFTASLAFLEIQAVLIGVVTAFFVPHAAPVTVLNVVVNVFLALFAAFLGLIVASAVVGFVLLLLIMGED